LSLTNFYDGSLGAAALFALAGEILLILSLLLKKPTALLWVKLGGLGFLWSAWYYIIHNYFSDPTAQLGFWTGIPFLVSSGMLTYRLIVFSNPRP
jgi:hypothetical protein